MNFGKQTIGDICWVYIAETNGVYSVCFTTDLLRCTKLANMQKRNASNGKVLFFRQFSDSLLALGYRLMLVKLSTASLEHIILQQNPFKEDLLDKWMKQVSSTT